MSDPIIITDPADVADLPFGTPYVLDVGFNEPDHDPEAFADAYAKARAAIPATEPVDTEPPTIEVSFTDTHAVFTSPVDSVVAISGDVRDDDDMKLAAGKPKQRRLTNEGHGFVSVEGKEYPRP